MLVHIKNRDIFLNHVYLMKCSSHTNLSSHRTFSDLEVTKIKRNALNHLIDFVFLWFVNK